MILRITYWSKAFHAHVKCFFYNDINIYTWFMLNSKIYLRRDRNV